jgi:hypothetical protein
VTHDSSGSGFPCQRAVLVCATVTLH